MNPTAPFVPNGLVFVAEKQGDIRPLRYSLMGHVKDCR